MTLTSMGQRTTASPYAVSGRPRPPRRIVIYGQPGSGKSVLAHKIADRLGLPMIELDAVHFLPDWQRRDQDEAISILETHLEEYAGGWVCDGNWNYFSPTILPPADMVIWLRLPWRTCFRRLLWRTVGRGVTMRRLWGVNRESLLRSFFSWDSILLWSIRHNKEYVRSTGADLADIPHNARVIKLHSPRQVRDFLDSLPDALAGRARIGNNA